MKLAKQKFAITIQNQKLSTKRISHATFEYLCRCKRENLVAKMWEGRLEVPALFTLGVFKVYDCPKYTTTTYKKSHKLQKVQLKS